MTDAGHCIHTSYIESLQAEARKEYERAEDYRDSCRIYKTILQWVLLDIRHELLTAPTLEEATFRTRKLQSWLKTASKHLP